MEFSEVEALMLILELHVANVLVLSVLLVPNQKFQLGCKYL
jgi:hypothetical protein